MYADLIRYLKAALLLTILALASLVTLHLLDIPSGAFVDWIVGLVTLWWLTFVTTVPWNVHFEATEALRAAATADARGIAVDTDRWTHVRTLAHRALLVAIALHLLTGAGLYGIAALGWSPIGYVGAVVAVGLTFARPAGRAYAYLTAQLRAFRRDVAHPHEDVVELRQHVRALETMLDLDAEHAWATQVRARLHELRSQVDTLARTFERADATNRAEHEQLAHEYRAALATVTEDRRFVEHLREIVRFVRSA